MIKAKYQKLIDFVEERYNLGNTDEFSEEFVQELLNLKDPDITINYDDTDWKRLLNLYEETESFGLIKCLYQCKHLPEEYFIQLFEMQAEEEFDDLCLLSEYVPEQAVKTVMRIREDDLDLMIMDNASAYSTNAMDMLCDLIDSETMKKMKYIPYSFLKKDTNYIRILPEMIKNTGDVYFYGNTPPDFLTAIINNHNMPDKIRNLAFDEEYSVDNIEKPTQHMVKEIYPSLADAVFEIENDTPETGIIIHEAHRKIKDYIKGNILPESCQLDYLHRFSEKSFSNFFVMNEILRSTKSPTVFRTAYTTKPSFKEEILKRPEMIDNFLWIELLKTESADFLKLPFLNSVFENDLSYGVQMEFLKLEDPYIYRAMVTTDKSDISHFVLMNINNDTPLHKEIKFLIDLKEVVSFLPSEIGRKIMASATQKFLNLDIQQNHLYNTTRAELSEKLDEFKPFEWPSICQVDYEFLRDEFKRQSNEFSEFEYVNNFLKNKLEETYVRSQLIEKYPHIFFTKIDDVIKKEHPSYIYAANQNDINCKFIDIDAICNLSENDMREFIEDIKQTDNQDLLKEFKSVIESHCSCLYSEQDNMFIRIYKLADLYDLVDNKLKEIDKEIKEKLTDDLEI